MKRILKKNQIIITTLAIMVAVAGYLNYSGRILEDEVSTDEDTVLLSEDVSGEALEDTYTDIVSLDGDGTEEAANDTEGSAQVGEAVLASTAGNSSIVAAAKLNREQVRAKSKEELLEVVNNQNLGNKEKQEAAAMITNMAKIGEQEAAAELLLETKGFEECIVSITDGKADVIVNETQLSEAQRAQIEEDVKRKTNISGENIVITPGVQEEGETEPETEMPVE